jgi:hypothetical protein
VGSSWDASAGPLDTRRRKDIKFREGVLEEELEGLPLNNLKARAAMLKVSFKTDREPSLQHVSRLKYGGEAEQRHKKP